MASSSVNPLTFLSIFTFSHLSSWLDSSVLILMLNAFHSCCKVSDEFCGFFFFPWHSLWPYTCSYFILQRGLSTNVFKDLGSFKSVYRNIMILNNSKNSGYWPSLPPASSSLSNLSGSCIRENAPEYKKMGRLSPSWPGMKGRANFDQECPWHSRYDVDMPLVTYRFSWKVRTASFWCSI